MKIDFKNIKKEFSSGHILQLVDDFFGDNIKKIIFLLFFILSGYCGYVWYIFVFNPQWSVEKEEAYLKTKDKEVMFNRDKFQAIVKREEKRAQEYAQPVSGINDIFRLGQ